MGQGLLEGSRSGWWGCFAFFCKKERREKVKVGWVEEFREQGPFNSLSDKGRIKSLFCSGN